MAYRVLEVRHGAATDAGADADTDTDTDDRAAERDDEDAP
jgi:hypothetical protein